MACYLGARLARCGAASVTLAGTWTAGLAAVAERGISVTEAGSEWMASAAAAPLGGPFGPADVVLVLVKAYRTEAVAPIAARVLLPGGLAFTLQNGLRNLEALESGAPAPARAGSRRGGAPALG